MRLVYTNIMTSDLRFYIAIEFGSSLKILFMLCLGFINTVFDFGHFVKYTWMLLKILLTIITILTDQKFLQSFITIEFYRIYWIKLFMTKIVWN